MAYCAQCRIGTLDQQGLCVLCGAPAEPANGWRRVAEAVATPLGAAWSPVVLVVLAFLVAVTSYALLLRAGVGQQAAVGLRAMPRFGAASALATLRTNPSSGLLTLLAPAILQAIVFAIVLMLVVVVSRRRRTARSHESGEDHRLPALGA